MVRNQAVARWTENEQALMNSCIITYPRPVEGITFLHAAPGHWPQALKFVRAS